jgi:hypothetical protein
MHEAKTHEQTCFLTLTFEYEPKNQSLDVKHVQTFMKALRHHVYPKKVRYFASGEYGEMCETCGCGKKKCRKIKCGRGPYKLGRAHYHVALFGYEFKDQEFLKKENEFSLWTSKTLDKLWSHGSCTIGKVAWDSAVYVAKYTTKKITGEKAKEHYGKRKPEFATMSRKPGIGYPWFKKFRGDVYPEDEVIVNGRKTKPPRAYDKWLEQSDPETYARVKARREEDAERVQTRIGDHPAVAKVPASRNAHILAAKEKIALGKAKK